MRYCYECNRITHGEPLFCNFCGRSYNAKLCPRLHKNPRNATACAQCGSRELSTPAPKAPAWIALIAFIVSFIPGLVLLLVSLIFVIALIHALFANPRILLASVFLGFALTVLWAMWARLPLAIRRFIRKQLLERGKERRP